MLSVLFVQRVMCALFNSRWLFSASLEFAVIFLFTCMRVWRFDYVRCFPSIFVSIKRTAQPKRKICKVSAAAYSLFQTDFEIRRPKERRRRRREKNRHDVMLLRNALVRWPQLCMRLFVRLSVCIKTKLTDQNGFLKSKSNFPIHKQHNQIAFVCSVHLVPRLFHLFCCASVCTHTINAIGTLTVCSFVHRFEFREQSSGRKKSAFDSGLCKVPSPSVNIPFWIEEHYRWDKIAGKLTLPMSCQCQMENTTPTIASEMKNENELWKKRRRRREMPHSNVGHWCVTQFGQMSHLSTSEHYWILSAIPLVRQLFAWWPIPIYMHFVWEFRAWLLEIFNATTLQYAVDVRQTKTPIDGDVVARHKHWILYVF